SAVSSLSTTVGIPSLFSALSLELSVLSSTSSSHRILATRSKLPSTGLAASYLSPVCPALCTVSLRRQLMAWTTQRFSLASLLVSSVSVPSFGVNGVSNIQCLIWHFSNHRLSRSLPCQ